MINTPPKPAVDVLDLSKLTHREGLKRSLVGVGGLEVRGRQCLALTSACYLMIARSKASASLSVMSILNFVLNAAKR